MTQIPTPSNGLAPAGPPEQNGQNDTRYERPCLTVLGTLSELTQGGNVSGNSDGYGYSGGSGVIP